MLEAGWLSRNVVTKFSLAPVTSYGIGTTEIQLFTFTFKQQIKEIQNLICTYLERQKCGIFKTTYTLYT